MSFLVLFSEIYTQRNVQIVYYSSLPHQILLQRHRFAIEGHAHFHDLAAVGLIGQGIALAVDLVESLPGAAVHLQLKHVGRVGHSYHHIRPPTLTFHLRTNINVQHREYQV